VSETPDAARPAVLIVDNDEFEASYVETVLVDRGVHVIRSTQCIEQALDLVRTPGLRAAIIAQPNVSVPGDRLASELREIGIPYLTLARPTSRSAPLTGEPALTRPFAAYQVADWVLQAMR
jgi:hypothetical protein